LREVASALLAFCGGVALGDPIGGEGIGKDEDTDVGKAEFLEGIEGRADVGTLVHRAAAAVENDVADARHVGGPLLDVGDAFFGGTGADESSAGDVAALEEGVNADVDDLGRVADGFVDFADEINGLDGLLGSPGIGGGWLRLRLLRFGNSGERRGEEGGGEKKARKGKSVHTGMIRRGERSGKTGALIADSRWRGLQAGCKGKPTLRDLAEERRPAEWEEHFQEKKAQPPPSPGQPTLRDEDGRRVADAHEDTHHEGGD